MALHGHIWWDAVDPVWRSLTWMTIHILPALDVPGIQDGASCSLWHHGFRKITA
jgi:hypothetical protein